MNFVDLLVEKFKDSKEKPFYWYFHRLDFITANNTAGHFMET